MRIMLNSNCSPEQRVAAVVQRMFQERAISRAVGSHDKLVEVGLTSLDIVKLVLLVEQEFDVELPISDITPTNFSSITAISDLISKLLDNV